MSDNKDKSFNEQLGAVDGSVAVINQTGAVANTRKGMIACMIDGVRAELAAINEGFDLDFVHVAKWLVIDKKGNYVEKDTKDTPNLVSYGDKLDAVFGYGEKRYTLWGEQESPEDGILICAEKEYDDALAKFEAWLAANPQAVERYNAGMIELTYLTYLVPVESLKPGEWPKIYIMSLPKTTTISFGKFAFDVAAGNFTKNYGIPSKTGIGSVVVRLGTQEFKQRANANVTWLGMTLEPVGLFRPEDYDLQPNTPAAAQADATMKAAAAGDVKVDGDKSSK